MITKIIYSYASEATDGKRAESHLPTAVAYSFGPLLILLGIAFLTMWPKMLRKSNEYKEEQLKVFNKNRPNQRDVSDYKKTGLYLPMWQMAKKFAPIVLGIVFITIGISLILGKSLNAW